MTDAAWFSVTNVAIGFGVSWLLGHYVVPAILGVKRHAGKATSITIIFTIAALIRNWLVYAWWTQ